MAVVVITTVPLDHCVTCGQELAVTLGPVICRTCRGLVPHLMLRSSYHGSLIELIGGMEWRPTVVVAQVDGGPAKRR